VRIFAISSLCLLLGALLNCPRDGRQDVNENPTLETVFTGTAEYDEAVAAAQVCAAGEQCVIAGGVKGCRCPVAVRASEKQRVDDAARRARCRQVERLYCPPLRNPRCEKNRCVADQVPE
jgi:hypothetical protein